MKIINFGTPMVMSYYFSENELNRFKELCKKGYCSEFEGRLYYTLDYSNEVYRIIRIYRSKIEKITLGNQYKYEYELDKEECKGDKLFVIHTDNCHFYKCTLESSGLEKNSQILLVFNIEE